LGETERHIYDVRVVHRTKPPEDYIMGRLCGKVASELPAAGRFR
jgi:hypothetical protein